MAAGDRIFMAKESTSQEILSNTKKIIEDAKAKPKRYGMRINLLDSNPATRVKYLYDAVGMTPAGMNFAGGGFDYGDWGDIWFVKKNRPVMVRTDGTVPCEADCSSGVAAIVKGAGYRLKNEKLKNVSTACYTGNLRAALKAAGFEVLTDKKYLTSDAYLLEGDILLNDGAHVATNLTNGAKASGGGASQTVPINSNVKLETAKGFNKSLAGTYKVTGAGALNLRSGAGTGKDKKVLTTMQSGETCQCYGYYTDVSGVKWLYVAYKNVVGFASSKYLKK